MLKLAICDDEDALCSQMEAILMKYAADTGIPMEVSLFNSGQRLCERLASGEYFDLIFLDIEMEDCDGIETGRRIRTALDHQRIHIVFISWKDSYCKQLFAIRPTNFLQKPLTESQIIKEILFLQSMKPQNSQMYLFKIGQTTYKLPFADILSFESQNKKVMLTATKGGYQFYDTIDHVFAAVQPHRFIRIHKSCIVNYLHVVKFAYEEVTLTDKRKLPISQSRRTEVRAAQIALEKEDILHGYF